MRESEMCVCVCDVREHVCVMSDVHVWCTCESEVCVHVRVRCVCMF